MLSVTPAIALDESELDERLVRASGPGGQIVDQVETALGPRSSVIGRFSMSTRTRRTFIKEAAAGAAGTAMLGSRAAAMSAASQDRVAGANRRVRVALIGCGGQGNGDLRAALRLGAE